MALTRSDANRRVIIGIVGLTFLIAGFLLGFMPLRMQLRELRTENQELQRSNATLQASLRLAELRGAAGLIRHRVNQNNFNAAAELATGFFNGVRQTIEKTEDAAVKTNLKAMLLQRDEITTGLAEADPAVKEKMAQIYAGFFSIRASR